MLQILSAGSYSTAGVFTASRDCGSMGVSSGAAPSPVGSGCIPPRGSRKDKTTEVLNSDDFFCPGVTSGGTAGLRTDYRNEGFTN